MESAPIFLGFKVKEPWTPDPKWCPECAGRVERVCSVADCLAEPPPGWMDRWDFNRAACYTTEAEALATVPPQRRDAYALFAWWLMPVTRDAEGQARPVNLDDLFPASGGPLPPRVEDVGDYDAIGYDVVGTQGPESLGFECSPLSCNSLAAEIPVNRYCLIDGFEDALHAARRFNAEQPEPGAYFVVKVAMKHPVTGRGPGS